MKRKLMLCLLLLTSITLIFSSACYANSAEPPSIFIIVEDAPSDMEIRLDDKQANKNISQLFHETEFSFYKMSFAPKKNYTLDISYSDEKYSLDIYASNQYSNLYTLDYKNKTIAQGKSPWRSAKYIILRVIMTLLIEALVFFAFRFKGKKLWLGFFTINLFTQGVLNIWLSVSSTPWNASYLIIGLVIGELFVFVAEIIAFLILIKDIPKWKTILYVLAANNLSLFLGGYLLTIIPV